MTGAPISLSTLLVRAIICCENVERDLVPLDGDPVRLKELADQVTFAHRRPTDQERVTAFAMLLMQALAGYADARADYRVEQAKRWKRIVVALKAEVQADGAIAMEQERGIPK